MYKYIFEKNGVLGNINKLLFFLYSFFFFSKIVSAKMQNHRYP